MALTGKLLRGTRFGLAFASSAHDLETTDFTVVAHGPPDPDTGEFPDDLTWRWRPGGASDAEFEWDAIGEKLKWVLTGTWTADGFAVGVWRLYLLVGEPADQDNMTEYSLTVRDGKAGRAMPVVDV